MASRTELDRNHLEGWISAVEVLRENVQAGQ